MIFINEGGDAMGGHKRIVLIQEVKRKYRGSGNPVLHELWQQIANSKADSIPLSRLTTNQRLNIENPCGWTKRAEEKAAQARRDAVRLATGE